MTAGPPKDPVAAVEQAIEAIEKLRRVLSRVRTAQVTREEERDLVQATALGWIRSERKAFPQNGGPSTLEEVDACYRNLFDFSKRAITRARYKTTLRELRAALVRLRSQAVEVDETEPTHASSASDGRPDFTSLVADPAMQTILARRWDETAACLRAGAHLAATVMMGALLEALFLARANHLTDKAPLYKATTAPKDPKTGKPIPLSDWTLKSHIEVAHELRWIRQSARDVSVVLRDWRNYIHPAKQLAHKTSIEEEDTAMFWAVFTSLATQVLRVP